MTPLVVSFYTKNTPYEEEAKAFVASCEAHDILYEVEALQPRGSWDLNCALKAQFLLKKLQEKKRPLLWVDIDGRFLQPMPAFDWGATDLSLRVNAHLPECDPNVFYGATIYVSYTPQTVKLLEAWAQGCEEALNNSDRREEVWDQEVLHQVFQKEPTVSFRAMPWKFAKVFDVDEEVIAKEETIIEHTQASRRLKADVCSEAFAALRVQKVDEMLKLIDAIPLTIIVNADHLNLMEIGTCLYSLVPFLKKSCVVGHFQDLERLQTFSSIAKIYPFIPFVLSEDQVQKEGRVLHLQADQVFDSRLFFLWTLEQGRTLPAMIEMEQFLRPLNKKVVDLLKHPLLA